MLRLSREFFDFGCPVKPFGKGRDDTGDQFFRLVQPQPVRWVVVLEHFQAGFDVTEDHLAATFEGVQAGSGVFDDVLCRACSDPAGFGAAHASLTPVPLESFRNPLNHSDSEADWEQAWKPLTDAVRDCLGQVLNSGAPRPDGQAHSAFRDDQFRDQLDLVVILPGERAVRDLDLGPRLVELLVDLLGDAKGVTLHVMVDSVCGDRKGSEHANAYPHPG